MQPGVYQMTFRGLTFKEAWRFGKEPLKFTIAVALKLIGFKGPKQWLPPHECESPCEETMLSTEARQQMTPLIEQARALGYTNGHFTILSRNLDAHTKEGFACTVLHADKMRSLFIGYIASDASGVLRRVVSVTGGLSTPEQEIEFVNHGNYFDSGPWAQKVQVAGKTLGDLDVAMQNFIATSRTTPRHFSSVTEMRAHSAMMGIRDYESRIARGLFEYIGEEAAALPLRS